MRKTLIATLAVVFVFALLSMPISADKGGKNKDCVRIKDGTLLASTGEVIKLGFDEFGYNYQAHMFNGIYSDADRVHGGLYSDVSLIMWWNDAWLSNKDCDGDSLLDRHNGYDSYIGSGAWLTNHQWGTYDDGNGYTCDWNYFVKIVAVPDDAYQDGGYWYTADGIEIGTVIWGSFARILQVSNDPCLDEHGVLYRSPNSAGFGKYGPKRP